MHRDVTRAPHWPQKSAEPQEIAQRSRDQERGRVIMILYKPIVASVVVTLMIVGLAAAQDATKRPPAPATSAPTAAAPAASVLGEVRKAGRYEITQRATVLDAVALAGGFNDWARRSKLVIMRQEGNGVKRIPVNYNRIVAEEDENVILQPGDIVVVP